MNEFDYFVKHSLKVKNYARYTDDFVVVSRDRTYLENLIKPIQIFLKEKLHLDLHPNKVVLKKYNRGTDFLGYVILPHHTVLRTKTKHRIFRKLKHQVSRYKGGEINKMTLDSSLQSYLGVLSHADTYELTEQIKNQYWFWLKE